MLNTLIGNNDLKETVKSAVISGRFPHAFILEGEQGSGRHTLARIIAAAAICSSEDAPCKKCRECELIMKDGFCDVLTYAPDGATFKVDTVRTIRDNAFVLPIEAKRKVNILLDCDKMNESAQNAFLKILEEPPSFMVFILICRNASDLLPTVRSRCITLSLKNPETDDAVRYISKRTAKSEADIKEALENSHGNIGKALEILDGSVNSANVAAAEYFEAIKSNDRLAAIKIIQKYEKDRLGFNAFLGELRLIAQRQAQNYALKKSDVQASTIAKLLKLCEETEVKTARHIGQPLSVQILSTSMTAEIFAEI